MKRIAIFSLAYFPYVGGAEVAVKEITDRIPPGDFAFDVITLRFDRTLPRIEKFGNVTIHRVGPSVKNPSADSLRRFPLYLLKVAYPILAYRKARSLDKRNPYDALWAMMTYMGFPALFFRSRVRKIPFLLTLQEGDTLGHVRDRARIRAVGGFYKKVFQEAGAVQAISNYLADYARSMGAKVPVELVPNGVDVSLFSRIPDDEILEDIRRKFNMRKNERYIITTSRLTEKNGVGDLIASLQFLPEDVKLLVLGTGPLETDLRREAKSIAGESGGERVQFLGQVPYGEISNYLFISDVFCRPSLSEGFGSSFIEAMAAGIPVVATPVGGIPDFLRDGETGLFCEPENPATEGDFSAVFCYSGAYENPDRDRDLSAGRGRPGHVFEASP
jgi:glycosyltransferase involved in cell wall biosynthesis